MFYTDASNGAMGHVSLIENKYAIYMHNVHVYTVSFKDKNNLYSHTNVIINTQRSTGPTRKRHTKKVTTGLSVLYCSRLFCYAE